MALYAIGDLHLSLRSNKPMEIFGDGWRDYVARIREGFSVLTEDDVTVLCGDLSWGMSLEQAREDFAFLDALPGRKILLKGNHDYWWTTAAKMERFFAENGFSTLEILHNNCRLYGGVAKTACAENDTLHNMPFEVTPETVFAAIKAADAYGKYYLGEE